jgi:hypothetical protein
MLKAELVPFPILGNADDAMIIIIDAAASTSQSTGAWCSLHESGHSGNRLLTDRAWIDAGNLCDENDKAESSQKEQ